MDYLHSKGIAHRDIKPENLLLNESLRVVLSDFGSAEDFSSCTTVGNSPFNESVYGLVTDTVGSPMFWAPECIQPIELSDHLDLGLDLDGLEEPVACKNSYSAFTADVWALGITMYCMCYLCLPYDLNISSVNTTVKKEHQLLDDASDDSDNDGGEEVKLFNVIVSKEPIKLKSLGTNNALDSSILEAKLLELLRGLTEKDPSQRWSLGEVLAFLE